MTCGSHSPEALLDSLQEGSHENAKSALSSFQSLVSNQLAKMEKDFQAGKAFPDLPIISDPKAFQVPPLCLLNVLWKAPQEAVSAYWLCTLCCSTTPWHRGGSGTLCYRGLAELLGLCCQKRGMGTRL